MISKFNYAVIFVIAVRDKMHTIDLNKISSTKALSKNFLARKPTIGI